MNDDDNWERSAFENEEEDEDNSPVLQKFNREQPITEIDELQVPVQQSITKRRLSDVVASDTDLPKSALELTDDQKSEELIRKMLAEEGAVELQQEPSSTYHELLAAQIEHNRQMQLLKEQEMINLRRLQEIQAIKESQQIQQKAQVLPAKSTVQDQQEKSKATSTKKNDVWVGFKSFVEKTSLKLEKGFDSVLNKIDGIEYREQANQQVQAEQKRVADTNVDVPRQQSSDSSEDEEMRAAIQASLQIQQSAQVSTKELVQNQNCNKILKFKSDEGSIQKQSSEQSQKYHLDKQPGFQVPIVYEDIVFNYKVVETLHPAFFRGTFVEKATVISNSFEEEEDQQPVYQIQKSTSKQATEIVQTQQQQQREKNIYDTLQAEKKQKKTSYLKKAESWFGNLKL